MSTYRWLASAESPAFVITIYVYVALGSAPTERQMSHGTDVLCPLDTSGASDDHVIPSTVATGHTPMTLSLFCFFATQSGLVSSVLSPSVVFAATLVVAAFWCLRRERLGQI